jgi:DNA topoisomerase-1
VELLAQARDGATVLRVLGDHPDDNASIEICSGRYGPYVRHGKVNATLPKGISPDDITLEEALELIAAKVAKGPVAKKTAARTGKKTAPAAAKTRPSKAGTGKPAKAKAMPAAKKTAAGKTKKPAVKKATREKSGS